MATFWWLLYSSWTYSWDSVTAVATTQDRFIFDWYSLDTNNIRIQTVNHDDIWNIDLATFNAPRVDGWWVLGHYYTDKDIEIKLTLKADTSAELNTLIDELKKRTRKTEWLLEILVNWEYRVCNASITNLKFNRQFFHITFCSTIDISFKTMDPHWRAKTSIASTEAITWDIETWIDNLWTVETDCKYYFIFEGSWNAVSKVKIIIWDFFIQVDETITNNDVLIIDWIEKLVSLNGTNIDYTWSFPELDVWFNPVDISFWSSDTVNCSMTYIYPKRYK